MSSQSDTGTLNFDGWTCPLPLRDHPNVILGHGGGGKLSAELVEHLFVPAFANSTLATLGDASVVTIGGQRLAFTTDSFVVKPLFFPGGSIGDLAVNGTVNDLAMMGAKPMYLSAGFIIEEGLPMATLGGIVDRLAAAAQRAGVSVITGDTKVVDKGHGDGLFINTSGLGLIPDGVAIGPQNARPGDHVIVSGNIGEHGMAIMSVREGLEFESVITSDCAPLNDLVEAMLNVTRDIHAMRDPTRGGLASSLNEIARTSQVGISIDERKLPVTPEVASACELLGMDPVYVANEGKLVAIVPPMVSEALVERMREHPLGRNAVIIGEVIAQHPGILIARTGIGGTRIIDMQIGEQLPRIC
ncbi:MAG TPA: hydrogenase expression/formation protein HypE [Aggregatilineales bacterium]|nr:hydrogenase expression/formation protein HypE [Aggregatilineales bacterium]